MGPLHTMIYLLSTVFYIGKFPYAPATLLSFLLCVLYYYLASPALVIGVFVVSTILGCVIARRATQIFNSKDPGCFVLDEVAGMSVSLLFLPLDWKTILAAFVLFRLFDILKPLGVDKLDKMDHPMGIVLDDILAGIYTNMCLQIIAHLYGSTM